MPLPNSVAQPTTIGFGADFAEQLLTDMADAGGGNGHFAASPEDAPGIFATEIQDLVSLVAQNVSVEVRGGEHVQVLGVLNEFPCVGVDGGIQAQLGDAYGGETRRVVFRLHVPSLQALGPATIGEVVLRYVSIGGTSERRRHLHRPELDYAASADDRYVHHAGLGHRDVGHTDVRVGHSPEPHARDIRILRAARQRFELQPQEVLADPRARRRIWSRVVDPEVERPFQPLRVEAPNR